MSTQQGLTLRSGFSFVNPPNTSNSQPTGDTTSNKDSERVTGDDTTSTSRNDGAESALEQRTDPTPNTNPNLYKRV